jgi:hypothetical protein
MTDQFLRNSRLSGEQVPGRTTATAGLAGRWQTGESPTRLLWAKEIITQPFSKG